MNLCVLIVSSPALTVFVHHVRLVIRVRSLDYPQSLELWDLIVDLRRYIDFCSHLPKELPDRLCPELTGGTLMLVTSFRAHLQNAIQVCSHDLIHDDEISIERLCLKAVGIGDQPETETRALAKGQEKMNVRFS